MKKVFIALVILGLLIIGLSTFGGRDFSQISGALDNFQTHQQWSKLGDDLAAILAGETIGLQGFGDQKYNQMVFYRWTDELGQVHVSQYMPDVEKYETVPLSELNITIQEGMSEEEIQRALASGKDDPKN